MSERSKLSFNPWCSNINRALAKRSWQRKPLHLRRSRASRCAAGSDPSRRGSHRPHRPGEARTDHAARCRVRELVAAQLTAAQNLQQQQQALQQQASQQRQEALRQFAEHQDALLEKTTAWGNESAENKIKIANSIIEHYGQYGVSKEQVLDAYQTNPGMRHAATRELLADGIRYRMARAAVGRAAARRCRRSSAPGSAMIRPNVTTTANMPGCRVSYQKS